LVEKNPFYKVLVTTLNKAFFTADSRTISLERQFNRLIKDARKSRARLTGFKGKVEQFFIPTDDRIFAYMEAEDKTKIANSMTQEELAAALFMQKYYADAREHLIVHETMEKGRENYITHIRRGFLEAWKQDGVAVAVGEIVKQAQQDEMTANILSGDKIKNILPLEKFFKFSMRRTGGLAPTKNIARAFIGYAKQFERKKSYDSVLAKIDIYTRVLTPEKKTKGGVEMDETLRQFVNTWVNTRKGRRAEPIWQTGSKLDWAVGAINTYVSIKFLGLNVPTGLASHVGEQVGNWLTLGEKKYALGVARLATRKGQEIVKKYENYTGRTPFDELFEQTRSIPERVSEFALFGLFQSGSVRANKQFLLGSLTAKEWDSGELSTERLSELKIEMGRWRVVHETSSVMGATTFGKVGTRFKSWAFVMANRTIKDIGVVIEKLRSSERKDVMQLRETHELLRIVAIGAFLTLLTAGLDYDEEDLKPSKDDTFEEAFFKKALRDLLSPLQAMSPETLISVPVALEWLVQLAKALSSLARLEEYEETKKGEYREGDLKALNALPKIILPNFLQ
jgi:hypothetical protein